jgi:proline racemase
MNFRRLVQVVDTHTAGEPTHVVTAGFPRPPPRHITFIFLDNGGYMVIFGYGQIDHPCGTETCAKIVFLYMRGVLHVKEEYHYGDIFEASS